MEQKQTTRKTYLDILRVFACLSVIYNHVAGREMRLMSGMSGLAALFLFYVSKTAVPLFLLISGALLLGRKDGFRCHVRRILRMALVLVVASLFYYGMNALLDGTAFRVNDFLLTVYRSETTGSFWYLYLYLGVLVMLPVLQPMAQALGDREKKYFLLASGAFSSLLPLVFLFLPAYNVNFTVPLFSATLGLLMAGYAVDGWPVSRKGARIAQRCALPCAVLLPLVPTLLAAYGPAYLFNFFDNYFLLTATGSAVGIFYACRYLWETRPPSARWTAFWERAGSLTFGTFLLGDFLAARCTFLMRGLDAWLPVNLAGAFYTLAVFLLGMGITWLLKRIPFLRRAL